MLVGRRPLLLIAALLVGAASRKPSVGDALEWRTPRGSDYLKDKKVVGVITPNSGMRRTVDRKTNTFQGLSRRCISQRPLAS